MERRCFILRLGATGAVSRLDAPAQSGRIYRLGILVNTRNLRVDEFLKSLRERGYVEGQNLCIEWRLSEGNADLWLPLARELVARRPDVSYVQTTPAALAANQATRTILIDLPTAIEYVGAGLAATLA